MNIKPLSLLIFMWIISLVCPLPEEAGTDSEPLHAPVWHAVGQYAENLPEGPVSFHCEYIQSGMIAHLSELLSLKELLLFVLMSWKTISSCLSAS